MLNTLILSLRRTVSRPALLKSVIRPTSFRFASREIRLNPPTTEKDVPPQESASEPAIENDYKYSLSQLEQIYKALRNQIPHMEIKKAVKTLNIFALHKYENDHLYAEYEKTILKHIHALQPEDLVMALKSLAHVNKGDSDRFVLMIENKIIKLLPKFDCQQYVDVLKSMSKGHKGSTKFYRNMQTYFITKIREFSAPQIVDSACYLIISKKLLALQFDELIYHVYHRFPKDLSVYSPANLIKFLNLVIMQKQEDEFQSQAPKTEKDNVDHRANIMSAISGVPLTPTKIQTPEVAKNRPDLEKLIPKVNDKLQEYASKGMLTRNQIVMAIQKLKLLNANIPEVLIVELVRQMEVNHESMYPEEFKNIFHCLSNIEMSPELKQKLEASYSAYFDKFFNDMDDHELADSWSLIDYAKFADSENMVKRIQDRIRGRINALELPALIRFTHLRIKTAGLLANKEIASQGDELMHQLLLPKVLALLKRNKNSKDAFVVAKWLIVLPGKDEKLLEDFINIVKDFEVKNKVELFFFSKFLKFIGKNNENLNTLARSTIELLENKLNEKQLQTTN